MVRSGIYINSGNQISYSDEYLLRNINGFVSDYDVLSDGTIYEMMKSIIFG